MPTADADHDDIDDGKIAMMDVVSSIIEFLHCIPQQHHDLQQRPFSCTAEFSLQQHPSFRLILFVSAFCHSSRDAQTIAMERHASRILKIASYRQMLMPCHVRYDFNRMIAGAAGVGATLSEIRTAAPRPRSHISGRYMTAESMAPRQDHRGSYMCHIEGV